MFSSSPFGPEPFMFRFMFTVVPILVFATFAFVIGSIILRGIRNVGSPVLVRDARVIGKRQHVSGGGQNHMSHTSYFVTFDFPDGNREELQVAASEYAMLIEGDVGTLRSQGTWFKGFNRGSQIT